jgi:hypothetical protein
MHTLKLQLKDYSNLEITARRNYWADDAPAKNKQP